MKKMNSFRYLVLLISIGIVGCSSTSTVESNYTSPSMKAKSLSTISAPSPDPRVGLGAGLFDAEEAIWNLEMVSQTPPPERFVGVTNSDLAFKDNYAFQGNYNGVIVWDISDPANPELVVDYLCPASQSDVSVYGNLMFVSGEGLSGRLDCGTQGVQEAVSKDRLRGIRIFDITDVKNPKYISNVQTCRGSHTHSVLKDPQDDENIYIYVSGSAGIRPDEELPGCSNLLPEEDPNSSRFRIEIIKVPLDDPAQSAIVSSPRIFENLNAPPRHGNTEAELAAARSQGRLIYTRNGSQSILSNRNTRRVLDYMVAQRGGEGTPTAADSTALRGSVDQYVNAYFDSRSNPSSRQGPTQCHDITLYPEIGLAGGACEGYGLLLDISDPVNPKRLDAVADRNFSYWHSATFSNDGTKVLFTDEWGGGGQPKCRDTDPYEWGANAIFTINDGKLDFKSYYKLSAPQTSLENCVAHNGSLIPIPGREIMVQSWYQGGISIFDWTDPSNPIEIAYHDRGPSNGERRGAGGSWSVYWYNGSIVNSEIARGLDIFKLVPNAYLTENEIAAANTVKLDLLNAQGQPKFTWPASFALTRAYVDQLERSNGMSATDIDDVRKSLYDAENGSASNRSKALTSLATSIREKARSSSDRRTMRRLIGAVQDLAASK